MKSLVLFNYHRLLKSKILMITSFLSILFLVIVDLIWVNIDKEIYLHWVHYGFLVMFICFVNIFGLSIIMIEDINNGIVSLEVRKGINYKWILWVKLGVLKSITYTILLISMLLFFVIIQLTEQEIYEKLLSGHLPGYAAIFGLDLFLTGLGIFLGSLQKLKVLISTLGFISGIFVFSPIIGAVHLIPFKSNFITWSDDRLYNYGLFQKQAQKKSDGLLNFLYENLQFYNEKNIVEIIKRDDLPKTDLNDNLNYEQAKEFIKNNGNLYTAYMVGIGQPLLLPFALNNYTHLNKESYFVFTQEYKDSVIYNFLQDIHLDDQPESRNPNLNLGSNSDENYTANKKNHLKLLTKYISYLKTESMIKKLEKNYGLKNLVSELNIIEELLTKILLNNNYSTEQIGNPHPYNATFFGKSGVSNKILIKDNFIDLFWSVDIFEAVKSESWLYNGNLMFVKLLFNVIAFTANSIVETTGFQKNDSTYEMIYHDTNKRNILFLYNPITSFPYMTLLSGNNKNPIINNELIRIYSPSLAVQDLKPSLNTNTDNSERIFKDIDKLPISEFVVTRLVIPTYLYYLPYFFLGFCFGTVGLIIYQRKIRP